MLGGVTASIALQQWDIKISVDMCACMIYGRLLHGMSGLVTLLEGLWQQKTIELNSKKVSQ